jgi:hypothetical protein
VADVRPLTRSCRSLALVVLCSLALLPGCGRSPSAPANVTPMLTGYVYEVMLPGAGEPPISDVLITVTQDDGGTSSARTDDAGFYRVPAATGAVLVTASKDGYRTRESRFEVTDSTVLNFALRPSF